MSAESIQHHTDNKGNVIQYTLWEVEHGDAALVAAVEALGPIADSPFSTLKVVSVPSYIAWEVVQNVDGTEHTAEQHRIWS